MTNRLEVLRACAMDLAALARDADAAKAFVQTLAAARQEAEALAAHVKEIEAATVAAKAEFVEWQGKVSRAKQDHANLVASIASMNRSKAAFGKELDEMSATLRKGRAA